MRNHPALSKHQPVSRRKLFKQFGMGITQIALLSLYGCRNTDENYHPKLVSVPQLHRPSYDLPDEQTAATGNAAWTPLASREDFSRWNAIVVHHTATPTGSAASIGQLHKRRGFDGLGYDFIINNGTEKPDGLIEVGYRWTRQITGAHCHPENCVDNYWNEHSIGIALIGNFENTQPTYAQYQSLAKLLAFLQNRYAISDANVLGHKQVPHSKTKCPGKNFSWQQLQNQQRALLSPI